MYDNSPKQTQTRVPSPRDIRLGEEAAKEKTYYAFQKDSLDQQCASAQQEVEMPACAHLNVTRMQLKDQRDRVHDEYWICLGCGIRFAPQI